ncbi:MAG TPA: hypothetical protein VHZ97_22920 [Pseudonocardiaceae bacterium]|nr:hypothetical protein [Pseudonocardiaceae bacterium]
MRLVRLGTETSRVGVDLRAALSSWGRNDTVLGGIALLGLRPPSTELPVDAVLLVPRGVLVIVGVDLPDPAMRLDAPLAGQWKTDGWPLVRPDGVINPAGEALGAAAAVARQLQASRVEPVPVTTIIAVGPFVGQVMQPTTDLHRGVRVLHPQAKTLLTAVRELATYDRPCTVDQAQQLLKALAGDQVTLSTAELTAEGFPDVVSKDLATQSTTLIPKIADADPPPRPEPRPRRPGLQRWLPIGAAVLLGALLIAGIGVALASSGGSDAPSSAGSSSSAKPTPVTVHGAAFMPQSSAQDSTCAGSAYGDVQVWLTTHNCQLDRSLYSTVVNGQPVAVAVAVLNFTDPTSASSFASVANAPGSGSITDLVAEGKGWAGGPKSFNNAVYSVTAQGSTVRLVEVVWIKKASQPTDSALKKIAGYATQLPASF